MGWQDRVDVNYDLSRLTDSGLFPALPALDITGIPELTDEEGSSIPASMADAYRLFGLRLISIEVLSQRLIHISGTEGLYDELTAQVAGSFDGRLLLAKAVNNRVTASAGEEPGSFQLITRNGTMTVIEVLPEELEAYLLDEDATAQLIQTINSFEQAGRTMSHFEHWVERNILGEQSAKGDEVRLVKLYFEPLEPNWISPAHIIIDLRNNSIHSFEDGEFHPDTWWP